MKIMLNENYRLDSIEKNFEIEKKRVVDKGLKAGEVVWENIGYYGTNLDQAIKGVLKHQIMSSEVEGVQSIIDLINENTKEIIETLKDWRV